MKVAGIHLAPGSRLPMRAVADVVAEAGKGLVGDRYHGTRHRLVTVQSQDGLDLAAADLGRAGSVFRVLRHAGRYLFRNELPRTAPQLDLLTSLDRTTLEMRDGWF